MIVLLKTEVETKKSPLVVPYCVNTSIDFFLPSQLEKSRHSSTLKVAILRDLVLVDY